jgi:predicted permease
MGGVLLDVFVPVTMQRAVMAGDRLAQRGSAFLQVMGRLSPNADLSAAQASADVVAARLAAAHPGANEGRGIKVNPLWRDGVAGMLMPVMGTLMAVVGVVLLIACANLAGLLLARAAGRTREVAIRMAVGASRGRLIRQFLLESLLLAAGGGMAGVVLSYWTAGGIDALMPPMAYPVALTGRVSAAVLAFAVSLTFVTVLVFGLLPAVRASRPDLSASIKDDAPGAIGGAGRGRLRQSLVVAQVALSMVLLVCAALFLRSLSQARTIDPGFTMRSGIIAALDLLPNGYDAPRGIVFYEQLLAAVRQAPGVTAATVSSAVPLDLNSSDMAVDVDGYTPAGTEEMHAYYNRVATGYFDTLGVPIVEGRAIGPDDVEGSELSVVVNETMARRYWPGRSAVGGIVRFGSGPARVVGIAADGKYGRLNEQPRNYMYVPLYQYYRPDVLLQVRTAGEPDAVIPFVQGAVKRLDVNLPLFDVRTMEEHLELSVFVPRLAGLMLGLFGALALLLAVVGLYGVIAFSVAHRTREIGVRIALGASRGEILRMVLRQGMLLTLAGVAIGLGLGALAGKALEGQLMGVAAADPVSFGLTAVILVAVALAACGVPARRAAVLDPLVALRRD